MWGSHGLCPLWPSGAAKAGPVQAPPGWCGARNSAGRWPGPMWGWAAVNSQGPPAPGKDSGHEGRGTREGMGEVGLALTSGPALLKFLPSHSPISPPLHSHMASFSPPSLLPQTFPWQEVGWGGGVHVHQCAHSAAPIFFPPISTVPSTYFNFQSPYINSYTHLMPEHTFPNS